MPMIFIKSIASTLTKAFALPEKRYSALITLLISVIIITPLCGFLFQCGCDWPWRGLDANCNFYKPHEEQHCPWCASMLTGILSTGLAIMGGVYTSLSPLKHPLSLFKKSYLRNRIIVRTSAGLSIFFLLAIFTANIAAFWQGYLLGVGRYL